MDDSASPPVSLIVRSSARASLRAALDSIGLQDYPQLEVIVAAANGRDHPALADRAGTLDASLTRQLQSPPPLSMIRRPP